MIFEGSRYSKASKINVKWPDQNRKPTLYNPPRLTIDKVGSNFFVYETAFGDELDALAQKYGENFEEWYKIAELNEITFPLDPIQSGTSLLIPSKHIFSTLRGGSNLLVL